MKKDDRLGWTKTLHYSIIALSIALIKLHWFLDSVMPNHLKFDVKHIYLIPFFETRYLYLFMHFVPIVPILLLSFDRKVAFFKTWRYLFPAVIIVAVPFWIWDILKTERQVWGFNPKYYTQLIINLPIEEWFFFITFPWASVFIYLCLNAWFPTSKTLDFFTKNDKFVTIGLIVIFFAIGFTFIGHLYTVTTFGIAGTLLLAQYLLGEKSIRPYFYRAFLVATIPFILINSVFTGAFTVQPIVVYNPDEYIGKRFGTIPLDDFAYNFALQFGVIVVFYFLQQLLKKRSNYSLKEPIFINGNAD